MSSHTKKVYVGLSGGVDSSVSALLLKEGNFDVTGVFIKIWHPDFLQCDWKSEMRDAMRVCAKLDIPFKMLDLSKEYEKKVINYMISEYREGRTPNPDIMCNKYIKFGHFFDWAIKDGADFVATGHYAQTKDGKLLKAVDQDKDQTYFLWTLQKDQLEKILFPIGHLPKPEVRKIAEKNNLITADKKDSQGLCFVGPIDIKGFLKKYIDVTDGNVLNEEGEVIGSHDGAVLYTIGERHGFLITKKETDDKPKYIISRDIDKNTITVSDNKPITEANTSSIKLRDINIINKAPKDISARLRYRQLLEEAILTENTLIFKEDIEMASVGQSAVFYKDDECLGGGIIN